MWNIHPALAPSVFILLLADPAMRRGIPMRLDTPDRLVRGSPAIQSYRYGFLLASRIVRAHRVRHSIALIAPSVPDRIMAVHRSAHPSGVTCIDRIAVFARLPGISRPPNRTSVLWARCAALDAARVGNDSPRRPDVFRLDSRLGRDDREAASFAHSALYRHPAGLSLFYGSRLPMGGGIVWMHGLQPDFATLRWTRARYGQACGNEIATAFGLQSRTGYLARQTGRQNRAVQLKGGSGPLRQRVDQTSPRTWPRFWFTSRTRQETAVSTTCAWPE